MFVTMLAIAAIFVLAPIVLMLINNIKIVVAGVILAGISAAYLISTLPPHTQK